jgi:GLPGLI family protein
VLLTFINVKERWLNLWQIVLKLALAKQKSNMKRLLIASAMLIATPALAQVKEGKIVYERTMQLNIRINDDNPAMQNMIPRERKDKFELMFTEGKSLWQPVEDDGQSDETAFNDGGGMRMVFRMPGSSDIVFHNITDAKKTEQRELADKNYLITDSIRKLSWKVGGETKTILGHNCMKATTQRMQEAFRMTMENGEAKRERVMDTLKIVAWFTNEIPGSFGPDMYQGQLPGTILEIDINNGRSSFRAIEISPKADIAKIKEPAKGKKVTNDEFAKEREKLMQEMQQNGGGPGGIRVNIRN